MKREIDLNAVDVANENKLLREELERVKTIKSRNYSPAKFNDMRLENKTQITSELEKLVNENDRLKELVICLLYDLKTIIHIIYIIKTEDWKEWKILKDRLNFTELKMNDWEMMILNQILQIALLEE